MCGTGFVAFVISVCSAEPQSVLANHLRLRRQKHPVNLRGRSKRTFHSHSGSAAWGAIEFKRPVQLEHAFSHVAESQPSRFSGLAGCSPKGRPGGPSGKILGEVEEAKCHCDGERSQ